VHTADILEDFEGTCSIPAHSWS